MLNRRGCLQGAGGVPDSKLQAQERKHQAPTLWWMEVVAVRVAELLLDTAAGLLPQGPCTQCCKGLPDLRAPAPAETLAALRDLLPTLLDLHTRAVPEALLWRQPIGEKIRDAWFTQEYLASLIGRVRHLLQTGSSSCPMKPISAEQQHVMKASGLSAAQEAQDYAHPAPTQVQCTASDERATSDGNGQPHGLASKVQCTASPQQQHAGRSAGSGHPQGVWHLLQPAPTTGLPCEGARHEGAALHGQLQPQHATQSADTGAPQVNSDGIHSGPTQAPCIANRQQQQQTCLSAELDRPQETLDRSRPAPTQEQHEISHEGAVPDRDGPSLQQQHAAQSADPAGGQEACDGSQSTPTQALCEASHEGTASDGNCQPARSADVAIPQAAVDCIHPRPTQGKRRTPHDVAAFDATDQSADLANAQEALNGSDSAPTGAESRPSHGAPSSDENGQPRQQHAIQIADTATPQEAVDCISNAPACDMQVHCATSHADGASDGKDLSANDLPQCSNAPSLHADPIRRIGKQVQSCQAQGTSAAGVPASSQDIAQDTVHKGACPRPVHPGHSALEPTWRHPVQSPSNGLGAAIDGTIAMRQPWPISKLHLLPSANESTYTANSSRCWGRDPSQLANSYAWHEPSGAWKPPGSSYAWDAAQIHLQHAAYLAPKISAQNGTWYPNGMYLPNGTGMPAMGNGPAAYIPEHKADCPQAWAMGASRSQMPGHFSHHATVCPRPASDAYPSRGVPWGLASLPTDHWKQVLLPTYPGAGFQPLSRHPILPGLQPNVQLPVCSNGHALSQPAKRNTVSSGTPGPGTAVPTDGPGQAPCPRHPGAGSKPPPAAAASAGDPGQAACPSHPGTGSKPPPAAVATYGPGQAPCPSHPCAGPKPPPAAVPIDGPGPAACPSHLGASSKPPYKVIAVPALDPEGAVHIPRAPGPCLQAVHTDTQALSQKVQQLHAAATLTAEHVSGPGSSLHATHDHMQAPTQNLQQLHGAVSALQTADADAMQSAVVPANATRIKPAGLASSACLNGPANLSNTALPQQQPVTSISHVPLPCHINGQGRHLGPAELTSIDGMDAISGLVNIAEEQARHTGAQGASRDGMLLAQGLFAEPEAGLLQHYMSQSTDGRRWLWNRSCLLTDEALLQCTPKQLR